MRVLYTKLVPLLVLLTSFAPAAHATYFDPSGTFKDSGLPTTTPTDLALGIIQYFLGTLAVIALVLIIYAGVMIMTSSGNEERVQKGFATLRWTVIGLLVIMSSWGMVLFIDQALQAAQK